MPIRNRKVETCCLLCFLPFLGDFSDLHAVGVFFFIKFRCSLSEKGKRWYYQTNLKRLRKAQIFLCNLKQEVFSYLSFKGISVLDTSSNGDIRNIPAYLNLAQIPRFPLIPRGRFFKILEYLL